MRDLYDFFDDNGVYVSLSHYVFGEDYIDFIYLISIKGFFAYIKESGFKSREDAEYAAFVRAFEILEEQLENRV